VKKPVNIAKLAKQPQRFEGKTVRLEGTVKEVCQGRGCWIEVATPKGDSFLARSLDESVLVPKDCKGQRVVVQGVVAKMPVKAHEHPAGEAEEGHSCPAPVYVVSTQGVELEPAKQPEPAREQEPAKQSRES
jgi:hypothetical protein